jgi:SAM-dependent methyltransferase
MNMTGSGTELFEELSQYHFHALAEHIPIEPGHSVLEIGCGIGRDAMLLTDILEHSGNYLGIDIIKESIDWCTINITAKHPRFRFRHFDISDQLHNPRGRLRTRDTSIPLPDNSVDRIFLWSVFTHMPISAISHYLREFARVLKPTGKVFATWFIVNDDILAAARSTNLTPYNLRFSDRVASGCYINDRRNPMGAIAYTEDRIRQAVQSAGLEMSGDFLPRNWSGYFKHPKGGQDATVLSVAGGTKSVSRVDVLRTELSDLTFRMQIARLRTTANAWPAFRTALVGVIPKRYRPELRRRIRQLMG